AAVCPLSPSPFLGFAPPAELGLSGPVPPGQVPSPFEGASFATVGLTPAGLAYYPLLGLGLLSFAVNLPRLSWQRLLPWLALGLLSAVQVRAVPFFAVVAAPVTAWNLQEVFARQLARERGQAPGLRRGGLGLRVLTAPLAVAFLVCAGPGWLRAPPFEPRRWAVETAPSLERGGQAVAEWRRQRRLADDAHGLHLSPETASAFAWF